jgi:SAM-dependent methyltransferase
VVGAVIVTMVVAEISFARADTGKSGEAVTPCVQAAQILDLAQYFATTTGAPDSYNGVIKAAFDAPGLRITAFEESPKFVYAVAAMRSAASAPEQPAQTIWIRRFIIVSPSVFIVDDQTLAPALSGTNAGCLASQTAPQLSGGEAHLAEASGEISAEILFPKNLAYRAAQAADGKGYQLEIASQGGPAATRIVQLLHVGKGARASDGVVSESVPSTDQLNLNVTVGVGVFQLQLPPPAEGAGEMALATTDGKVVGNSRPFPSTVLPHGPKGAQLLEYWDSSYRGNVPAPWDIGRPEAELQKFISAGTVPKCRVVDMCCGSGSDAVYLATQGFDVTAVDVAPTALAQGEQKARNAHVTVHWVLADLLAQPDLKPFDFIYDRACYHVLRYQNLAAYLETVRRFSHPGTKFLLLADQADDRLGGVAWGVTDDQIRFEFSPMFNIEWLREFRLESTQPGKGWRAWSAFMTRKAGP